MPARRLGEAALVVRQFDVLGIDADSSPGFVRHVGLARDEGLQIGLGSTLPMVHMGPPLGTQTPSGPIPGDGPWPVVLAGYVLNSLNRDEDEIRSAPYNATAGDEFFPPRTPGDEARVRASQ